MLIKSRGERPLKNGLRAGGRHRSCGGERGNGCGSSYSPSKSGTSGGHAVVLVVLAAAAAATPTAVSVSAAAVSDAPSAGVAATRNYRVRGHYLADRPYLRWRLSSLRFGGPA